MVFFIWYLQNLFLYLFMKFLTEQTINYKDFLRYHYGKHDRSDILFEYFNTWMDLLGNYGK